MRSAPDGQRATWAITSLEGAPSGSIQGFLAVSKTAARPLTHLPECWQTSASKLTVTSLPMYDLGLTARSSLLHEITNLSVRSIPRFKDLPWFGPNCRHSGPVPLDGCLS